MKIELSRIIDSSSPNPPPAELIVITDDYDIYTDDYKKKTYSLSEEWTDRFLPLMEKAEHSGTFGERGGMLEHHYVGYALYRPKEGREKDVEILYAEFRRVLFKKRAIKTIIFLGFLAGLLLLIL